eukprot:PITA_29000
MKILSFNYRGLASPEKKLALKHLLLSDLVDVILLQETLCKAEVVIPILSSWLSGWTFHALDVSRRSRGIAVGFKKSTINLKNIWVGGGFLGADIYSKDLEEELRIINVYGPCHNRELFWRRLLSSPLLLKDNISPRLRYNIPRETTELVIKSLARRLDRFIIKEAFHNSHPRSRQWVGSGGILDHRPIFLEVEDRRQEHTAPFKFNSTWLRDLSYINLITNFWKSHAITEEEDPAIRFVKNLSEIKVLSRAWAHKKREQEDLIISQAEQVIADLESQSEGTFTSLEQKTLYETLTKQRAQVLKDREASWRLRSKAIWLKEGDENTKFFHHFVNGRKAVNTI